MMFFDFTNPPHDPLWALTSAFRTDHRPEKLDLVLGVYRDESGITPVMTAVREAEIQLAKAAVSKTYRALSGNADFNLGMTRLLLGQDDDAMKRAVTMQTVGGTGALRLLGDLIAAAHPGATVWLSNPGYINHRPIIRAAGLAIAEYPWQERNGKLDLAAVLSALADARINDVFCYKDAVTTRLASTCHQPTGKSLPTFAAPATSSYWSTWPTRDWATGWKRMPAAYAFWSRGLTPYW
jgi:aspartate aminotransferase